jgi:hypothetical protein
MHECLPVKAKTDFIQGAVKPRLSGPKARFDRNFLPFTFSRRILFPVAGQAVPACGETFRQKDMPAGR